jgi:hypothetical protein
VPQTGGVQPGQVPQTGGVQPGQVPQTGLGVLTLPQGINQPLFLNPAVRRELNITDQQMGPLNNALTQVNERFRDDFNRLGQLDPRARTDRVQELGRNFNNQFLDSTKSIFNEQQMNRLRQLDLQRNGLGAFTDPTVRQKLNLNDEQLGRLRTLNEQTQKEREDLLRSAGTNRAQVAQRLNDLDRRVWENANSILNDQQRQTWSQMIGNRFNFEPDLTPPASIPNTPPR